MNKIETIIKKFKEANLLKTTEDNKYIISNTKVSNNIDNMLKLNPGKNFYWENLFKEIHLNSDYTTKKMQKNYIQEFPITEENKKNFVDLAGFFENDLFQMVEYKMVKNLSNIEKEKNNIYNQVIDYLEKYFKQYSNKNVNIIAITIVMFNDLWFEDIKYMDKYYDFNGISNKNLDAENSLKEFGIYQETKFYDIKNQTFLKKKSLNFPVIYKLKYIHENAPYRYQNQTARDLITYNELNKIPTRTSDFKIVNSREIIDITNIEKRTLILEIMSTILEGFKNNLDNSIMRKYSKDSVIVYLKDETFIKTLLFNNKEEIIITSTNSALIDGQQSFNTLFTINKILKNNNLSKEETKLLKELIDKIAKDLGIDKNQITQEFLLKIAKYIETLEFYLDIKEVSNSEEAKKISQRKNKNIPQKPEDIKLLKYNKYYRFLNKQIFDKFGKKLNFPNSTNYSKSIIKDIPVYGLINVYEILILDKMGIKNKNLSNIKLFINSKKSSNGKFKLNDDNISYIKELVKKDFTHINKEKKWNLMEEIKKQEQYLEFVKRDYKILSEINIKNAEINGKLEKLTVEKAEISKRIKKLKMELEEFKNEEAEILDFKNQNIEKEIYYCFNLLNIIRNNIIDNDIYKTIFYDNTKEKVIEYWIFYIIVSFMKKVKIMKKDLFSFDNKELNIITNKILDKIVDIYNIPSFNITKINNRNIENLKNIELFFVIDENNNKISYYDLFEDKLSYLNNSII